MLTKQFHPAYLSCDLPKYRLTYNGGRQFVEVYLEKFSPRENQTDFDWRRKLTYCPGFAAQGLDEIKNAIFQRMPEIIRSGGTESYNRAIDGFDGGVDLHSSSMNTFMGQRVLPELMAMGRCGVYVDMARYNPNATLADFPTKPHPYVYLYCAEDILNWSFVYTNNELICTCVLLREDRVTYNDQGLPIGTEELFRLVQLKQNGVVVQFWRQYFEPTTKETLEEMVEEVFIPKMPRIPFHMLDLGRSLLTNAADYQIALMNVASADLTYILHSNFPIYVEQYDAKSEQTFAKGAKQQRLNDNGDLVNLDTDDLQAPSQVIVGTMHGRRYPIGAVAPAFINPSAEPSMVSQKKQEQLKDEIRRLLNLNVANVAPTRASAESKIVDQQGLESGLCEIGMKLEAAERGIMASWLFYEGEDDEETNINYPRTYSLKNDDQRIAEATSMMAIQGAAPSKMYQKQIAKEIARSLLYGKVNNQQLDTIYTEIDNAQYVTSDWQAIQADVEAGLVDAETASNARGYDGKNVVPKAQKERVQRLTEIALAQQTGNGAAASAARGNPDGVKDAKDEKTSSQDSSRNLPGEQSTRGNG